MGFKEGERLGLRLRAEQESFWGTEMEPRKWAPSPAKRKVKPRNTRNTRKGEEEGDVAHERIKQIAVLRRRNYRMTNDKSVQIRDEPLRGWAQMSKQCQNRKAQADVDKLTRLEA